MKIKSISVMIFLLSLGALFSAQAAHCKQPLTIKDAMELDKQGRHGDAVEAVKAVIAGSPKGEALQKAHFMLGLLYFRADSYNDALGEFSTSVEAKNSNPMAYYFMGMIYERKALATSKPDVAKDMKTKALLSWQNYLANADTSKGWTDEHKNIGISIKESIKRAKNHVEILQEGLQ